MSITVRIPAVPGSFVQGPAPVSAKTANYAVGLNDSGTTFTTVGASASVTFTLLAATGSGNFYSFVCQTAADGLVIKAPTGAVIHNGASASSSGGTLTASTTYASLTLQDIGTNLYAVISTALGTWTAA